MLIVGVAESETLNVSQLDVWHASLDLRAASGQGMASRVRCLLGALVGRENTHMVLLELVRFHLEVVVVHDTVRVDKLGVVC